MYKDSSSPLTQHTPSVDLADRFNDFFAEKVQTIRDALPTEEGGGTKYCSPAEPDSVAACLQTFESVDTAVVRKVFSQMKMAQCLDSCPASLLRDSLPVITDNLY